MSATVKSMLLAGLLAVSACVSYEKPLSQRASFDATSGYIYGRFQRAPRGLDLRNVSLVLTGPSGKKVNIACETENSVYAVAVPPGTYQLTHFALAKGAALRMPGDYTEEVINAGSFSTAFPVAVGDAVYIGDWSSGVEVDITNATARLAGPADQFEATTLAFRDANPEFNAAKFRSAAASGR